VTTIAPDRPRRARPPAGSRPPVQPVKVRRPGRPRRRLVALFLAVALLLVVVVARVGMLQTVDQHRLAAEGESQRLSNVTLTAPRGTIFDRNGFELAISVPQSTVWADPRAVSDKGGTAAALAHALHLSAGDAAALQDRLSSDKEFVYVARQIDDATAKAIADLKLAGVYQYNEPKRFYPADELGHGLLGGTDTDGKGTAGLEEQFDSTLTGQPGELIRERDQQGRSIPSGRRQLVPAQPGNDLVLTIDKTLQYTTEQLLAQQVGALTAAGGTAVIMDTATGDILAMASVDRDPATGKVSVSAANKAAVDAFEPGSVAKIVPSSAVLDLGQSTPTEYWHITGSHKSDVYEIEDVEQHGNIDLTTSQIIAVSSNIGAVMIANRVGPPALEKYLHAYGFGAPSGLDLPHETPGILTPESQWSTSQRDTIAYGQGIAVTALQLTAAMNTIANDGTYVAPRLVDATIDQHGDKHEEPASSTHPVLKPATATQMTPILEGVWCVGTARHAPRIDGYSVAGKTGTGYIAQNAGYKVVGTDGKLTTDGYKDASGVNHYNASFAGYLPAENPRLTISVSIFDPLPSGPHFGGNTAAPVFSSIAHEALQQLQIPPSPNGGTCPAAPGG
jgi:cell division protein FtsI (penicillin-binding protein 3)